MIPDREYFVTKGVSIRLEGKSERIRQNIPVKPNRKYRISYFVRTEDLKPGLMPMVRLGGKGKAGTTYLTGTYLDYIRGTTPWMRYENVLTTPAEGMGKSFPPHLEFNIGKSSGKCWIDHVELYEIDEQN